MVLKKLVSQSWWLEFDFKTHIQLKGGSRLQKAVLHTRDVAHVLSSQHLSMHTHINAHNNNKSVKALTQGTRLITIKQQL